MARPKKNATVNEEMVAAPVEEKKTARRGRPRKNPLPATEEEVKTNVAAEASVVEEKTEEAKLAEEVKQPAKRGRRKKTETALEEKKTQEKKTAAEETEKQPAKRGRRKKTETVEKPEKEIKTIVQYEGKQIEEKEMIAKVENAWKAEGNTAEIESVIMYVKPQDGKIYYVINGLSGSVDLF